MADKFLAFLSEVQYPGSKGKGKDDRRLRRQRALFIMRERKLNSFEIARQRAYVMLRKRELIRGLRATAVSAKLGVADDQKSTLNTRVGVPSIDVEAPLHGVRDCCDLSGRGPTHMSSDDAELERLVAEHEVLEEEDGAECA